jgi:hypothetical protein
MSKYLATIASLAFAGLTGKVVLGSSTYLEPVIKKCLESESIPYDSFYSVKVEAVDRFLCLITPFFEAVLTPSKGGLMGIPSYMFVCCVFMAAVIFFGVESLRSTSRGLLGYCGIVFLIGQLITISVAVPLLLLPSYYFSGRLNQVDARSRPGYLSPDGVFVVAFCAWAMGCVVPMLPFGLPEHQHFWITVFQFVPGVALLIPISFLFIKHPKDAVVGKQGSVSAIQLYQFFTLVLGVVHLYTVYSLWVQIEKLSIESIFLVNPASSESNSLLLLFDALFLAGSLGLFILTEDGIFDFVQYFGLSLLIGPGSAFLLLAMKREQTLMKKLERLGKGDKSSKSD